jgi:ribosomal protein S18 acetylase RimI-like enzyme
MIITGEDVLHAPTETCEAHLKRITELVRLLYPKVQPLSISHLAAINASGVSAFYCVEGRIVGCGRLLITPHLSGDCRGTLESLVVGIGFRRRGIARALVEYRLARAKERNLTRVSVLTLRGNKKIQRLYRSLGFEEFPRTRFRLEI